jgi:hypothetical protein
MRFILIRRGCCNGLALALLCLSILELPPLHAATALLAPSADTSLMETFPDNNLGGAPYLLAGGSETLPRVHRALLQFDVANQIPHGSRITSARVILEVTQDPKNGYVASSFELHRVLRPWGEGTKLSPTNCLSCAGQGQLATVDEATWNSRFALTPNLWTTPGGAADADYVGTISSEEFVYTEADSPYYFRSTTNMIADVQLWLEQPERNFGWLIRSAAEGTAFSARRFGSRENLNRRPLLELQFLPPPSILQMTHSANEFRFTFLAEAGQQYRVEFRNGFTVEGWTTLTNIAPAAETSTVEVVDALTPSERFYRVVAP